MPGTGQLMSHIDSRRAIEVDIQHEARGVVQPGALKKILRGVEDLNIEPMHLQRTLHCPKDTRVIVYNDY